MTKRSYWYIAVSIMVSGVVFTYLLTMVRPAEIARAIKNASILGIAAYIVSSLITSLFRNWRYLILVRATDTDVPIGGGEMFLVTLVRNLFSDLLPARIGTLIYIAILKARFGFPVEIGTSTYAVAFILDLAVMVPLMSVGIVVVGAEKLGISLGTLIAIASIFSLFTIVFLFYLASILVAAGRISSLLLKPWGKAAVLKEKLELTAAEVQVIYRTNAFWKATVLSFVIRTLKYGCIAFLVFAILNPIEPETYTLRAIGYWPVFVGASLAELSASTPFSGIGGFGAYEGVWTGAFYLLGYPGKLAALSGISAHIITQAFGYSLGVIAILVLMVPLLRKRKQH
jgi:uncharacterized membrane protein YbhN (UPF0104 family)